MSTLAELKTRYKIDKAKFEPNPSCKFCHGNGEKPTTVTRSGLTFCICLFVDHEVSDDIGTQLGNIAKKELEKFKAKR